VGKKIDLNVDLFVRHKISLLYDDVCLGKWYTHVWSAQKAAEAM
jgi:hypothetical protein